MSPIGESCQPTERATIEADASRGRSSVFRRARRTSRRAQEALLRTILHDHRDTAYGRHYEFGSITDPATYRARVPFARFDDLLPWIDRMLAGEPDVLLAGQPIFFRREQHMSRPKHVGYPSSVSREYLAAFAPMATALEAAEPASARHAVHHRQVRRRSHRARDPDRLGLRLRSPARDLPRRVLFSRRARRGLREHRSGGALLLAAPPRAGEAIAHDRRAQPEQLDPAVQESRRIRRRPRRGSRARIDRRRSRRLAPIAELASTSISHRGPMSPSA